MSIFGCSFYSHLRLLSTPKHVINSNTNLYCFVIVLLFDCCKVKARIKKKKKNVLCIAQFRLTLATILLSVPQSAFTLLTLPSSQHTHTLPSDSRNPFYPHGGCLNEERALSLTRTAAVELFSTQCQQNRAGKTAFAGCKSRRIDRPSARPPPLSRQTSGPRQFARRKAAAVCFLKRR